MARRSLICQRQDSCRTTSFRSSSAHRAPRAADTSRDAEVERRHAAVSAATWGEEMKRAKVVIVGTLDTKGLEYAYLRDRLRELDVDVTLVDAGVFPPHIAGDIT